VIPNWSTPFVKILFDALKKTSILTDGSVPENINNQLSNLKPTEGMYPNIEIGQNKKEQDFVVKLSNICKSLETIEFTRARLTSYERGLGPAQRAMEILSEESSFNKIAPYLPSVYKFLKKSDEGIEKANKLIQKTLNILVTNGIVNQEFVQLELTKYTHYEVKTMYPLRSVGKDLEVLLFKNLTLYMYGKDLIVVPEKNAITSFSRIDVSKFSLLFAYVTGVFDLRQMYEEDKRYLERYEFLDQVLKEFSIPLYLDRDSVALDLFFTELESVLCQRGKFSLKEYFTSDADAFDEEEVEIAIKLARDILKKEMMKITKNIKKQELESKSIDKIWESIGKSKYGEILLTATPLKPLYEVGVNEIYERVQKAIGRDLDGNRFVSYGKAREGGSGTEENELSNSICSVSEIDSNVRREIDSLREHMYNHHRLIHKLSEMAESVEYDKNFFNIIDQRVKTAKIKRYESIIHVDFDIYNMIEAKVGAHRVISTKNNSYEKSLDRLCQLCFTLALAEMLKQFSIGLILSIDPWDYLSEDKQLKLSPECTKYLIIDLQIILHVSFDKRFADVFNKTKLLKSIRSLELKSIT